MLRLGNIKIGPIIFKKTGFIIKKSPYIVKKVFLLKKDI